MSGEKEELYLFWDYGADKLTGYFSSQITGGEEYRFTTQRQAIAIVTVLFEEGVIPHKKLRSVADEIMKSDIPDTRENFS